MARSRKSHEADEENTKSPRGLAPAYSGKAGGNRYVVYAHYPSEGTVTRALVWSLNQLYAAEWFIRTIIGPQGSYEAREDFGARRAIVTGDGIIISMYGDLLATVLEYEPTSAEAEWRDPFAYKMVMSLKYGKEPKGERVTDETQSDSDDSSSLPDGDFRDDQEDKASVGGRDGQSRVDRPSQSRADRPKQPRQPKPEGLVSAGDIAAALGVEAREVRGVLRSLNLVKPAHGWSWPKEEAESIKAQIKKGLKK